jgi:hypothetical protein
VDELLTDSLALWRLTRLVTADELTAPLRERAQSWALERRKPMLHYLLGCPYCMSVWLAPAVLVMPKRARRLLAAAGAVSLIAELLER